MCIGTCYLNENIKIKDLITSNTLLARIYGLPKVHKDNYPLRPVVSCVNCPTYNMSKIFNKILNDSLPKPRSFIKNSLSFRDTIIKNQIANNYIMISLDVMSLFTNIPIKLIQKSIEKIWHYIEKFTKLPLEEFKDGIEFLMNNTFFQFNNSFYRQSFGIPMGSPISPILADLVMQDLETNVLGNYDCNIEAYYRYVDDTIMFIPKDKIEEVLTTFNNYHDRLQFTYEIENEHNSINFLNLTIIKNEDNSIKTNWFRKNTYSGRFLNYFSNHPL